MAIITVWNGTKEQCGNTLTSVALATQMAIDHNIKVLLISTSLNDKVLKECFWKEKAKKQTAAMLGGVMMPPMGIEKSGVEGLDRIIRSNKMSPDIITDYTRVIFKDRLEILLGPEQSDRDDIVKLYPDILTVANQYYERIFVDLDNNVPEETASKIINMSDIIVVNLNQRLSSIEDFRQKKEEKQELKSAKILLLIGRYDRYSKYNIKNITRYLGEKNNILTIPYNTLFFEATEEAGVPDMFLRFKKFIDPEDRNAFFVEEVKRASDNIIYRIQAIQTGL